jgi:hypothetical protein
MLKLAKYVLSGNFCCNTLIHNAQVTLVGHVVSIQPQATNCVYWIDDGTGRIEARHWVDSSSEEDSGKWGGIEYVL